jgi:hypothetical protein
VGDLRSARVATGVPMVDVSVVTPGSAGVVPRVLKGVFPKLPFGTPQSTIETTQSTGHH